MIKEIAVYFLSSIIGVIFSVSLLLAVGSVTQFFISMIEQETNKKLGDRIMDNVLGVFCITLYVILSGYFVRNVMLSGWR